jgi:hypothetical protein
MKKVIWYLFDSGNGSGYKAFNAWNKKDNYEYFSIGLDRENKNNHFINCDLIQPLEKIIEALKDLPHPDIILASPPCESWSLADSPAQPYHTLKSDKPLFTPKTRKEFANDCLMSKRIRSYEKKMLSWECGKTLIERTFEIIDYYKPKFYLIENGAYTFIWRYIKQVLKRDIIENITHYSAYNNWDIKKPTKFSGNIKLNLLLNNAKPKSRLCNAKTIKKWCYGTNKRNTYNKKSEIPQNLLLSIYNQLDKEIF